MLNRRDLLTSGLAAGLATAFLPGITLADGTRNFGYLFSKAHSQAFAQKHGVFSQQSNKIEGSSEGKHHSMIPTYEKVTGKRYVAKDQQWVGSCGGVSGALGCEFLTTEQVSRGNGQWKGEYASEVIYAGARVEVGKGWLDTAKIITDIFVRDKEGLHDGCFAPWIATWLRDWGVVLRGKYGEIDLTKYDPARCREWGKKENGCPDALEPIAKEHPVLTMSYAKSFEEVCDLIYNGHVPVVFSTVGFRADGRRDKYGFMERDEKWGHVTVLTGFDRRKGKRPGCEVNQIWGSNWANGPGHEMYGNAGAPDGTFWADKDAINAMCECEVLALSKFHGYPLQPTVYKLW